jgi:hypothetical protein
LNNLEWKIYSLQKLAAQIRGDPEDVVEALLKFRVAEAPEEIVRRGDPPIDFLPLIDG